MNTPNIVIVGGSLAGLTLALACAARGVPVRVVERSPRRVQGGDSLSVSLDSLAAAVWRNPREHPQLPVVRAYRDRVLTTWPALYAWLYDRVSETPGITLEEGRTVTSIHERGHQAQLVFADGSETLADAVIGADGYNSIVRKAVAPEAPLASFAGYVVWRGLVEEQLLSRAVDWPTDGGLWIEFVEGYRLVAAVLPGRDGSVEVGQRQVTFAWFDAHQDELLKRKGFLTPDRRIVGSLGRGAIGPEVRAMLAEQTLRLWPATWAEAVLAGVRSRDALTGAPIAEYRPNRLVRGPLALVGDAAHVVTPMTGSGFATGVEDSAVLARLLADHGAGEPISDALAKYEVLRLPYVRALVAHSERLSADYVRYATTKRGDLAHDLN